MSKEQLPFGLSKNQIEDVFLREFNNRNLPRSKSQMPEIKPTHTQTKRMTAQVFLNEFNKKGGAK